MNRTIEGFEKDKDLEEIVKEMKEDTKNMSDSEIKALRIGIDFCNEAYNMTLREVHKQIYNGLGYERCNEMYLYKATEIYNKIDHIQRSLDRDENE